MLNAEELGVLAEIEALIASAGADSYIAMSFEGIPDMCRQNIADDAGNSLPEYRRSWGVERERMLHEIQSLQTAVDELWDKVAEDAEKIADLNHDYGIEDKYNAELKAALKDMTAQYMKAQDIIAEWQTKAGNMRLEIMELKAEIYDLRKELGK